VQAPCLSVLFVYSVVKYLLSENQSVKKLGGLRLKYHFKFDPTQASTPTSHPKPIEIIEKRLPSPKPQERAEQIKRVTRARVKARGGAGEPKKG